MENDDENLPKKESGCLFYNFNLKKNPTPISTEINVRNQEMRDMHDKIDSELEQFYGSQDKDIISSKKYYKYLWSHNLLPHLYKPKKKVLKKNIQYSLNNKIYFGTFFSYYDGYEDVRKYDKIKKIISRSSNFSFVKDPKSLTFSKLPFDLYLSKDDSLKLKELITIEKIVNIRKNNSKKILKKKNWKKKEYYSYNNILNSENNSCCDNEGKEDLKEKIKKLYQRNNKNLISLNKNNKKVKFVTPPILVKINGKENSSSNSLLSPIMRNYSTEFTTPENIKSESETNNTSTNFFKTRNIFKKSKTNLDLSKDSNIYTNLKININKRNYSNFNNKTYNQNFYSTQKKVFSNIKQKLNNIKEEENIKNKIKELSILYNKKCEKKHKKITKIIQKIDPNNHQKVMKIFKEQNLKNGINKKSRNHFYFNLRNQIRLLSILENLKNMKENTPVQLVSRINEDYYDQSKDLILNDKFTKRINNIYKSFAEGKKINEKISNKSKYINLLISKNQLDGVKLKNKYEKVDNLIEEIIEENNASNNYKMISYINMNKKNRNISEII